MARKLTLVVLALACAALLAPAGPATAAENGTSAGSRTQDIRGSARLFEPLTVRTARRLAVELARDVARRRNVRWWTLSEPVRRSARRVVFVYTDRSRDNVFCTSEVVVSQPHRRFRHTFFASDSGHCDGVPADALQVERALARYIRSVAGHAGPLRRTRVRILDEQSACLSLRVPRNRVRDATTLFAAWETSLLTEGITFERLTLVDDLERIDPQRPPLASARDRWLRIQQLGFDIFQAILAPQTPEASEAARSPCRALRRWARNGWRSQASPTDFSGLRFQLDRYAAQERGLLRVSRALMAVGVSPRAAQAMTPAGVLSVAVPDFRVCAGAPLGSCGRD
jgi:hypothetical protein